MLLDAGSYVGFAGAPIAMSHTIGTTGTMQSSFGFSSCVRESVGVYYYTFSNPASSIAKVMVTTVGGIRTIYPDTPSASGVRVRAFDAAGKACDTAHVITVSL